MIQYDNEYHTGVFHLTKNTDAYNQQATAETPKEFKVIAKIGLSNVEALQRIGTYGYNAIEEKINVLIIKQEKCHPKVASIKQQ